MRSKHFGTATWGVLVLAIASLAGCITGETSEGPLPSPSEPTSEPTTSTGPSPTSPSNPADGPPAPEGVRAGSNGTEDDETSRPMLLFGCTQITAFMFTSADEANAPLPEGWSATEAAAGMSPITVNTLDCDHSSRNNETFTDRTTLAYYSIPVRPPDEYYHGGGSDLFLVWMTIDREFDTLRAWGLPVQNESVEHTVTGPLEEVAVESDRGAFFALLSGQMGGNEDVRSSGFLHYQVNETIRTVRIDTHSTHLEMLNGPAAASADSVGLTVGPAIAARYHVDAHLELLGADADFTP